ncbi:hypothetical protein QNH20_14830 [Neobacillus sp. WH10]|uniref:hypothetical protein n=1 Tax=Neobacillus sp. WH10 TaxID=3047873 RepID=UPI0024C18335|nr:hypothetical protein [Neobacillus sp. WH10]WHY75419.1 hypothetical protein QNH20_14830 [Neobacillus sp. WH10]
MTYEFKEGYFKEAGQSDSWLAGRYNFQQWVSVNFVPGDYELAALVLPLVDADGSLVR